MDDEDRLGCGVEATRDERVLLANLQVAAVLLQVHTLAHIVLDEVVDGLVGRGSILKRIIFPI